MCIIVKRERLKNKAKIFMKWDCKFVAIMIA